jgi:hypothetical protein
MFHNGQVLSRITAWRLLEKIWLTSVGASVRFLTLTSNFFGNRDVLRGEEFVTAGAGAT